MEEGKWEREGERERKTRGERKTVGEVRVRLTASHKCCQ